MRKVYYAGKDTLIAEIQRREGIIPINNICTPEPIEATHNPKRRGSWIDGREHDEANKN